MQCWRVAMIVLVVCVTKAHSRGTDQVIMESAPPGEEAEDPTPAVDSTEPSPSEESVPPKSLTPEVVELSLTPVVVDPSLAPPVVEPSLAPAEAEPSLPPPVVEPSLAPPVVEPSLAPPVVEPVLPHPPSNTHDFPTKYTETQEEKKEEKEEDSGVVLVSMGGGEDEVVMAHIASLLHYSGHRVTMVVYGPGPMEELLPLHVKVLQVPTDDEDPMYPKGVCEGVTPGEESGVEWLSGRVTASRVRACAGLAKQAWTVDVFRRARLIVTPLFLHDVCMLALAAKVGVPAVGVVTSRVGAWWVWDHLGVLPPLSTTPVPPATAMDITIWARAANLATHYGYVSSVRQQWQVPAVTAVAASMSPPSLDQLYGSLADVLVAWDPLLDDSFPLTPRIVPVGAFHYTTGHMTKDVLVPALLNRAGVVAVSAGGREAWLGRVGVDRLYTALRHTAYTVVWRVHLPHLRPNNTEHDPRRDPPKSLAKFLFKEDLPLNDVLSHPRHRLLVSTCGETEVMAAAFFGSPTLCLPVTTDQTLAAAALKNLGVAEVLPAAEVTVPALRNMLGKMASDRSYRERGRKLAEELHDQALSPAERLLFILERVMRRPHSPRLRSRGTSLYLLQRSNADVYLLILVLVTTLMGVLLAIALALLPVLLKKHKTKAD